MDDVPHAILQMFDSLLSCHIVVVLAFFAFTFGHIVDLSGGNELGARFNFSLLPSEVASVV